MSGAQDVMLVRGRVQKWFTGSRGQRSRLKTGVIGLALQVSYLLGIPAQQLLPPRHSLPSASSPAVPWLLPWPEFVPQTPELQPHLATVVEGRQALAEAKRAGRK